MELIQARADIGPKFLAESDFLRRLRIVRWYDRPRLVDRKTYLLRRFRLGQRARLRNRRLSSGFRRCVCRANANDNHQHSEASPNCRHNFFSIIHKQPGELDVQAD
jgi:hypothetical protein